MFAWYHPGKPVHHVFLRKDGKIQFVSAKDRISAANGTWMVEDSRCVVWFHSQGKLTADGHPIDDATILDRVALNTVSSLPYFRATGSVNSKTQNYFVLPEDFSNLLEA